MIRHRRRRRRCQKKIIEKLELSEMARTLIEKSILFLFPPDNNVDDDVDDGVDDVVGGLRGGENLGFLRAQAREARPPLACASIFLSSSLFRVPYFSTRRGCPRVVKFYRGFLLTSLTPSSTSLSKKEKEKKKGEQRIF